MWRSPIDSDYYNLSKPRIADFQEATLKHCTGIKWKNPYAVTLTLRRSIGPQRLDQITASQTVHHFLNKMNRQVLGRRQSSRERLRTFSVFEWAAHPHVHLCIECPPLTDWQSFESAVRSAWSGTAWARQEICVVPCHQIDGWLAYMTKTRTKACYPEAIDWLNCY